MGEGEMTQASNLPRRWYVHIDVRKRDRHPHYNGHSMRTRLYRSRGAALAELERLRILAEENIERLAADVWGRGLGSREPIGVRLRAGSTGERGKIHGGPYEIGAFADTPREEMHP
jgi:hypothetical protein